MFIRDWGWVTENKGKLVEKIKDSGDLEGITLKLKYLYPKEKELRVVVVAYTCRPSCSGV